MGMTRVKREVQARLLTAANPDKSDLNLVKKTTKEEGKKDSDSGRDLNQ